MKINLIEAMVEYGIAPTLARTFYEILKNQGDEAAEEWLDTLSENQVELLTREWQILEADQKAQIAIAEARLLLEENEALLGFTRN